MTAEPHDSIWYRCSSDACDDEARLRLIWRVPCGWFLVPGPCPACGAPMALVGRVRLPVT